jgi:hypothetical protein
LIEELRSPPGGFPAKFLVGAISLHFHYHRQHQDLALESDDDLVFNPYLFRVFEAGKGPSVLKNLGEYITEGECLRQQRLGRKVEQEGEGTTVTMAHHLLYPEVENPGLFERLLADNLEHVFKRVRDMHDNWKEAGEGYLLLWKDFLRRQRVDSTTLPGDMDGSLINVPVTGQSAHSTHLFSEGAGAPTQDIQNATETSLKPPSGNQETFYV